MKIKKSIIIPEHSNTMYEHHFKSIILHYFEPGKQIMNHYLKKKDFKIFIFFSCGSNFESTPNILIKIRLRPTWQSSLMNNRTQTRRSIHRSKHHNPTIRFLIKSNIRTWYKRKEVIKAKRSEDQTLPD